jgi:pilus assembly protein FimV
MRAIAVMRQYVVRAATLGLLLASGAPASALGLGDAQVASAIGQPLLMMVPLKSDAGVELTQDCVRIVPARETGDSLTPTLNAARITIDAAHHQLRIESADPIVEPTLRVIVEAGCNERIRREFALLLDPPGVSVAAAGPVAGQRAAEPRLGLGMAQISAVLGQPLSVKVPVVGAEAGRLTSDCVHLADPISSEGAPVLRQADIRVVPQEIGSVIEVVTPGPVTEPAVRLALDVGCAEPLRREFAILLGLPTLAVSNLEPSEALEEPAPPPKPKPRPAPKHLAKAVPLVPPATTPAPVPRQASGTPPPAAPEAATAAPAPRSDRLVLASPQELPGPPTAADTSIASVDANAQMMRRIDAMSKQVEALEAQLMASRSREAELERRAANARSQWTWLIGGVGGLLLGAALVLAWRQRRPQTHGAWDSVSGPPTIAPVTRPAAAQQPAVAGRAKESAEIGGRATMAPAPTTIPAPTEPPITEGRHSPITVTELHDTVQVIKELYATVLERNTGAGAGPTNRPERPLELDLRAPTGGGKPAAPAASAPAGEAARSPAIEARSAKTGGPETRGFEERFTELPTELGLDLDLSSVAAGPATVSPVTVSPAGAVPAEARRSVEARSAEAGSAKPVEERAAAQTPEPPAPAPAPAEEHPFPDDHLTTTPTEIAIDIDVGTSTLPAEPPLKLEPIDLQLDLSKPESKGKRRDRR